MWAALVAASHTAGVAAGWLAVALLCVVGVVLGAVGMSGMWLVVAASALAAWLSSSGFPTGIEIAVFIAISLAVDLAEWGAGHWGVRRRGGSRLAGLAAAVGGVLGALLGFFIPIPLVGNLLGMMAGSFTCAYLVERHRLRQSAPAANIAVGAVLACLAVLFLKVSVTLGMSLWLWIGLWLSFAN